MRYLEMEITPKEFQKRLSKHCMEDAYYNVRWNALQDMYFAKMKEGRFHLYYKPRRNRNAYRTYLRGKILEDGSGRRIRFYYSKERVIQARSFVIAAICIYTAVRLCAVPWIPGIVAFGLAGALNLLALFIKPPATKKRLQEKLQEILTHPEPERPLVNMAPKNPA